MTINKLPLIVIVGPTASGKTSLAINVAKRYNGEIICADSRSIYIGADIGTAKATKQEMSGVVHWGIDLVEPGQYYSAVDFKNYAMNKIDEIRSRNKLPILVGGTGLYVDAVIFDYKFGSAADMAKRQQLNNLSLEELYEYCKKNNITLPENYKNKRYVVRAIEREGQNISKSSLPIDNTIIIGIDIERNELRTKISKRSEQFFEHGVVEEAIFLSKKYGWDNEAMKSNVYKLVREYLSGNMTLSDIKIKNATMDWRLAKRQLTWLKRNKYINWMSSNQIKDYLDIQLAKID